MEMNPFFDFLIRKDIPIDTLFLACVMVIVEFWCFFQNRKDIKRWVIRVSRMALRKVIQKREPHPEAVRKAGGKKN